MTWQLWVREVWNLYWLLILFTGGFEAGILVTAHNHDRRVRLTIWDAFAASFWAMLWPVFWAMFLVGGKR